MANILVVAPHPDDETLGCAGTLLKHKAQGDKIFWLVVSRMSAEQQAARLPVLEQVASDYGFAQWHICDFMTAELDRYPLGQLIQAIGEKVAAWQPAIVYLPFPGDVHSDHKVVFDAASSCCKNFRYPSVKSVRVYETLSETDFGLDPLVDSFRPNLFIDVSDYVDKKLEILQVYKSELGEHPFPRSLVAAQAQMTLRGTQANCQAAEAFMLLKEVQ